MQHRAKALSDDDLLSVLCMKSNKRNTDGKTKKQDTPDPVAEEGTPVSQIQSPDGQEEEKEGLETVQEAVSEVETGDTAAKDAISCDPSMMTVICAVVCSISFPG